MSAKITSGGDLTLESMPDAPDEEWLRAVLTDYNDFKRQTVLFSRAQNVEEQKSVNLTHDDEEEITSPLPRGVKVLTVTALKVEGLTLNSMGDPNGSVYALGLAVPLAWRPSTNEGKVFVRAKYDVSPSAGVVGRVNMLFVGE